MSTKLLQDNETNSVALVWPDMKNVEKYKNDLKDFYSDFINLLLQFNIRVFLVINDKDDMRKLTNKLSSNLIANLKMIKFSCDDIWIRDYSPLIALNTNSNQYICINYCINGYGGKYDYRKTELERQKKLLLEKINPNVIPQINFPPHIFDPYWIKDNHFEKECQILESLIERLPGITLDKNDEEIHKIIKKTPIVEKSFLKLFSKEELDKVEEDDTEYMYDIFNTNSQE